MMLLLAIPLIIILTTLSWLQSKVEVARMQKIAEGVSYVFKRVIIASVVLGGGLLFLVSYYYRSPTYQSPIVERHINEQYYFTQQQNGWRGSTHIRIYRNTPWLPKWLDQEVGIINTNEDTGDISVGFKPAEGNKINLLFFSDKTLVLDTVVDIKYHFLNLDQEYWNEQVKK